MYPIYIEQPRSQLSLNDYLQLQALLRQEQAEREHRLLQEYKKEQERRRIQKAMYKLQVMTELYRRREQEERAIQAYYAAKREEEQRRRQQELIQQEYKKRLLLARQRQQEQEFMAALQQRQELEEQCNLMALALQQQQQKSAEYANPLQALAASCCEAEQESETESEADEEESHQDQLATLVKMIFGAQEDSTPEQEEENDSEEEEEEEQPEAEHKQEDPQYTTTMNLDQFVDYISKKAQALDDEESEQEDSGDQDQAMEEDTALLALEHLDDDESMDEDDFEHIDHEDDVEDLVSEAVKHLDEEEGEEDEVPALVDSTQGIQKLVNELLTQEESDDESQLPTEDPVKIAKYDALHRIEQELNEIRQNHEDHVLHAVLDFSDALNNERAASPESTLLTATTAANREFLGYEDQIMKALLKLDMIQSDGDKDIRNKRKALVKLAEEMLDKLDEFKQKEWERVSCSSHSEDEDMYM